MSHSSGSQENIPRHVAIVMDGNGRWARARFLPRTAGHRQGVVATRRTVESCVQHGVEVLTVFAFSSENWCRPAPEVNALMELFVSTLQREARQLAGNGVRLRFIGDRSGFSERLREQIRVAEHTTAGGERMILNVAANYGGQWDIAQAVRGLIEAAPQGCLSPEQVTPEAIAGRLSTAGLPDPDLFIRTGGEQRISNFLLWQIAYSELYFTDTLWPDFGEPELAAAFSAFATRQRRFGKTGEQVGGDDGSEDAR